MLEKEVENYFNTQVRLIGGIPYKFISPGRAGVTDRLCVFPFRIVVFVELKRPGKKPRPKQWEEMARIKRRDHYVVSIDCFTRVDSFIVWVKKQIERKRLRGGYKYGNNIGVAKYRKDRCYGSAGRERVHYSAKQRQHVIRGGVKSGIRSFQKILYAESPRSKDTGKS